MRIPYRDRNYARFSSISLDISIQEHATATLLQEISIWWFTISAAAAA